MREDPQENPTWQIWPIVGHFGYDFMVYVVHDSTNVKSFENTCVSFDICMLFSINS